MPKKRNFPQLEPAKRRSRLEDKVEDQLKAYGVPYEYEKHKLKYIVPERTATYLPDFKVGPIFIEVKGTFQRHGASGSAEERKKLILVKEAHPHLDIRLVFANASQPIYKGSPTTLAKWAVDHGFPYADKGTIPSSWIKECQ